MALYRTEHRLAYADAGDVRTRYLEAGDPAAPTLLLLHGTAGTLEAWSTNIGPLAEHFHVLAIDMLGCGWTDKRGRPLMAADYARHAFDFLDAMGVGKASLMGVSLGTLVSTHMVKDRPERVDRLVMVSPAGIVPDPKYVAGINQALANRGNMADDPTWLMIRDVFEGIYLDKHNIVDDMIAVRLGVYGSPEMQREMQYLVTQKDSDYQSRDWWSQMTHPVLVIAHVDVPNMFLDNAYNIGKLAPNAQVAELKNCDHHAQAEVPDEFNAAAIAFLTS
jgi:pimeloyl-ACP methyl ester carboxylesterase